MIQEARSRLLSLCNHVLPTVTLSIVKEDGDDDRVLECAVAAKSDFIVTEDEDLLRVMQFATARIVTIGEFLKLVLSQERK